MGAERGTALDVPNFAEEVQMSHPTVGAVIVTHGSDHVLPDALASLRRHEPSVEVLVVDNASPGGPPRVPGDVRLIPLEENVGYGAACNRGATELADAGFIAFLNPDVRLTGPALSEIARGLSARKRGGVATGPVVDETGRRIPSVWGPTSLGRAFVHASGFELTVLRRVLGRVAPSGPGTSAASTRNSGPLRVSGHVLGGAMVVKRACFDDIEGFDERFFLYWEDADLCVRARRRGWEVWSLPAPPIVHLEGASSVDMTEEDRFQRYVEGARTFGALHLEDRRTKWLVRALRAGHRLRGRSRG